MTPFVHEGRLLRLELLDKTRGLEPYDKSICAIIRDVETGAILSRFGEGCYYYSGYYENGTMYVIAVKSILPRYSGDTYYTFRIGFLRGIVLDCGEDKPDKSSQYDNTEGVPHDYPIVVGSALTETDFLGAAITYFGDRIDVAFTSSSSEAVEQHTLKL